MSKIVMPKAVKRATELENAQVNGDGNWFRVDNKTDDATDVYIYDYIGIFGVNARDFAQEMKDIDSETINLYINSPGGSVFEALAIYNTIRRHSATVNVFIDGLAASAASFIAMAGDTVTIGRNSMMMIHDALTIAVGNAQEMREVADMLDMHSDNIADIYARRAGGKASEWRDAMKAETWYKGAEAVKAGLADEVTDPDEEEEDKENAASNTASLLFAFAGRDEAPEPFFPDNGGASDESPEEEGEEEEGDDTENLRQLFLSMPNQFRS